MTRDNNDNFSVTQSQWFEIWASTLSPLQENVPKCCFNSVLQDLFRLQQNLSRFARLSQRLRADMVVGSAGTSNLSLEVGNLAANFRIISRNQQ